MPRVDDFDSWVAGRPPRLKRVAYLLTGNNSDADDLVQDTFVRLLATGHSPTCCALWGRGNERSSFFATTWISMTPRSPQSSAVRLRPSEVKHRVRSRGSVNRPTGRK